MEKEGLLTLWRAENHRRRRKERVMRRVKFLANLYKLTKKLLGQKRAGCPTCSKDAIDNQGETNNHVPNKVKTLILDSAGLTTYNWHKLEVGIITGCTISVTLFALAVNMVNNR